MLDAEGNRTLVTVTFWDLVQRHRDSTGASEAWIMRRAGLNKGAFTAWRARGVPALPERRQLLALAEVLRVDYETLLVAMLHDAKYLPESVARAEADRLARLELEAWGRVLDLASQAYSQSAGDPERARAWLRARRGDDTSGDVLNAQQVLEGRLTPPQEAVQARPDFIWTVGGLTYVAEAKSGGRYSLAAEDEPIDPEAEAEGNP